MTTSIRTVASNRDLPSPKRHTKTAAEGLPITAANSQTHSPGAPLFQGRRRKMPRPSERSRNTLTQARDLDLAMDPLGRSSKHASQEAAAIPRRRPLLACCAKCVESMERWWEKGMVLRIKIHLLQPLSPQGAIPTATRTIDTRLIKTPRSPLLAPQAPAAEETGLPLTIVPRKRRCSSPTNGEAVITAAAAAAAAELLIWACMET
mmetsp:Transcript_12406/g.20597  ORF Transcript_12406/g.20597 Transcript_12406/m.20597 type:complete len:206 (+) Transcript_12406:1443-2060(+)